MRPNFIVVTPLVLNDGHNRHAVLVRFAQYPNNLFVAESLLLHSRLSLQKRPLFQASIGPKFTGQVNACLLVKALPSSGPI